MLHNNGVALALWGLPINCVGISSCGKPEQAWLQCHLILASPKAKIALRNSTSNWVIVGRTGSSPYLDDVDAIALEHFSKWTPCMLQALSIPDMYLTKAFTVKIFITCLVGVVNTQTVIFVQIATGSCVAGNGWSGILGTSTLRQGQFTAINSIQSISLATSLPVSSQTADLSLSRKSANRYQVATNRNEK